MYNIMYMYIYIRIIMYNIYIIIYIQLYIYTIIYTWAGSRQHAANILYDWIWLMSQCPWWLNIHRPHTCVWYLLTSSQIPRDPMNSASSSFLEDLEWWERASLYAFGVLESFGDVFCFDVCFWNRQLESENEWLVVPLNASRRFAIVL